MNSRQSGRVSSVKKYSRRSRPRAKSVTDFNVTSNSAVSIQVSLCKSKETEDLDQLTPLVNTSKETISQSYTRCYSLDSDPHYQMILYGTSFSLLTGGLSVSLKPQKQNSIVTIFAIWNTIIGSSLLAMPWSVQRAGLALAFILLLLVASLAVYTASKLLAVQLKHGKDDIGEVPYLCKELLGSWAEVVSRVFSFVIIFGANIVYWILMSSCLYHSVGYIVDIIFDINVDNVGSNETVLCPNEMSTDETTGNTELTLFQKIWNLEYTVPIFLIVIVAPLLNFKSSTFFTKLNSVGMLSVLYLLIFVIIKNVSWGVNVEFVDTTSLHFTTLFRGTFFATTGMLPLSLFIHNIVITLMRNNQNQKNNGRDLSVAYILVVVTYLLIGFTFYICFPLKKSCIEDNMLNNFPDGDLVTVVARIFLFFQLLTVFPLLSYMLRIQIFSALNYPSYPSAGHVMILNSINVITCVLFAIFMPHIGTVIRFTGAICGFVYIFTLPCLLHLASQRREQKLTITSLTVHLVIPLLGLINLVAQFFVAD